jgi:hypothetical protein
MALYLCVWKISFPRHVMLKSKKMHLLGLNNRVNTGRKFLRPVKWNGKINMEIIQKCRYQILGGNHKAESYRDVVAYFVQCYKDMGSNTSLKDTFLILLSRRLLRKSRGGERWTRTAISTVYEYLYYGKMILRQLDSQYAGWLLLDT